MKPDQKEHAGRPGETASRVVDVVTAQAESGTPIADELTRKLLPLDLWCQHGIHYERGNGGTYTCADAAGHPNAPAPPDAVPCQPLTPYDPMRFVQDAIDRASTPSS